MLRIMELGKNEYTIQSLLEYLQKKYKEKITGKEFNHSDVAQYCLRGNLPYRYGGNKLLIKKESGIKIITLK